MEQHPDQLLILASDLEILSALSQALTKNGRAVVAATDWEQATTCLTSEPLTSILYDVKELNHREWERLVALRAAYPKLNVVLMASLETRELEWGRQEHVIADYLMKPIRLPALEACLARLGVR